MEKVTFYTTIENQVRNDGSKGLLYDHFEDLNATYAKYYTILAAAAVSEIPYHSACIIRDDGVMMEGKVFDRRVVPDPSSYIPEAYEPEIVIEDPDDPEGGE